MRQSMVDAGTYHPQNDALIVIFVESLKEWRTLKETIEREGVMVKYGKHPIRHPLHHAYRMIIKDLYMMAGELGLSPKAKKHLGAAQKTKEDEALDDFLNRPVVSDAGE